MFLGIALLGLGVVVAGLLWTGRFKASCGECMPKSKGVRSRVGIGP